MTDEPTPDPETDSADDTVVFRPRPDKSRGRRPGRGGSRAGRRGKRPPGRGARRSRSPGETTDVFVPEEDAEEPGEGAAEEEEPAKSADGTPPGTASDAAAPDEAPSAGARSTRAAEIPDDSAPEPPAPRSRDDRATDGAPAEPRTHPPAVTAEPSSPSGPPSDITQTPGKSPGEAGRAGSEAEPERPAGSPAGVGDAADELEAGPDEPADDEELRGGLRTVRALTAEVRAIEELLAAGSTAEAASRLTSALERFGRLPVLLRLAERAGLPAAGPESSHPESSNPESPNPMSADPAGGAGDDA